MDYTVAQSDVACDRAYILGLWKQNLTWDTLPTRPQPEGTLETCLTKCAGSAEMLASETPKDVFNDRYAWLYESGAATSWVIRSQEGAPVGATGLMARTMKVFDQVVPAGQAIDLNVAQSHRSVGPAIRLQRAVIDTTNRRRLRLLYAFPNARSEPVLRRVGFRVLGNLERWAKPLRLEGVLKDRLPHGLVRKLISGLANPLLRVKSRETFYGRPPHLHAQEVDRFDERFDRLWNVAAPQFDIVGQRTSAYLTWRFGQCPHRRHRAFCLLAADGELLAYLVYHRRERTAYINDWLFTDLGALDVLLAEFIRRMRREKAETVVTVYLGSGSVCEKLRRYGFLKTPSSWKALLYVDDREPDVNPGRLFDKEAWHVTRADVDTDF